MFCSESIPRLCFTAVVFSDPLRMTHWVETGRGTNTIVHVDRMMIHLYTLMSISYAEWVLRWKQGSAGQGVSKMYRGTPEIVCGLLVN